MDKIQELRKRKDALKTVSGSVRKEIESLVDEGSFVELSALSFSKSAFYDDDARGEGVVTGFGTIGGYPFYLVAQNFDVISGGLTKANCEKIAKTLNAAEKNNTPVVYLLHSQGVAIGEGVDVLEGISELLLKATQLKGTVMQYAYLSGGVYGSAAALAAVCDVIFFEDKSALSVNSPLVLAAKENQNLKAEEVGGYAALDQAGLPAVKVKNVKEAGAHIKAITELLALPVVDAELNKPSPALNKSADAKAILSILENGLELGANSFPEVKTVLARIGGIAVAAVVFDQVKLNANNVRKIKNFAEFACCYALPLVTFVDCTGVEATLSANNSGVLKEIAEYLSILDATDTAKIAVVTGKAVGLGYSLFASKSVGFDYAFALATAEVSLFESALGAEIEYSSEKGFDKEKFAKTYA
ncbi:MAG: hypothetical protein K2L02_00715, partial [Clostridia bacterium]|nr:hypothetical protein [Clostridia bacterium]